MANKPGKPVIVTSTPGPSKGINWNTYNTIATNGSGNIEWGFFPGPKVKCDSCRKKVKNDEITFSYEGTKIRRNICRKCFVKANDKIYGVKIDADLEDTLYGKKQSN